MNRFLIIVACFAFLTGCKLYSEDDLADLKEKKSVVAEESESSTNMEIPIKTLEPVDLIDQKMKEMTLEEKVAQLFIVDFYTFAGLGEAKTSSQPLLEKFDVYPVGGVIFFKDNVGNQNQVVNFIKDLQDNSKVPLWISVDEEGGKVSRLQNTPELGMTKTPNAETIGKTLDANTAYAVAKVVGAEMNALGFNMDFAPVADVNTNANNIVIGSRAYSSNENEVAEMVIKSQEGFLETGIVPVLKHFPGHGDTDSDTHTGAVSVEHDLNRLKKIELVPFQQAIEAGAKCIMVAHISLPNVTGNQEPATLSYPIVTELLREEMGFDGVVITDSLAMGAITEMFSADSVAVSAIQAGVDILLMPEDFELAFKGILDAVENGEITEERIDESVKRILELKQEMKLFDVNRPIEPLEVVGSKKHQEIIDGLFE